MLALTAQLQLEMFNLGEHTIVLNEGMKINAN